MERIHHDSVEFDLQQMPLLMWAWVGPVVGALTLAALDLRPAATLLAVEGGLAWLIAIALVRPVARVRVGATRLEVEGWLGALFPRPSRRSFDLATVGVKWWRGTLELYGPEGQVLLRVASFGREQREALVAVIRERRPQAKARHGRGEAEAPAALRGAGRRGLRHRHLE